MGVGLIRNSAMLALLRVGRLPWGSRRSNQQKKPRCGSVGKSPGDCETSYLHEIPLRLTIPCLKRALIPGSPQSTFNRIHHTRGG